MRSKSNQSRFLQIGRPRRLGRAGGGAGSPELCSRGGAAPEKTELGLPGADSNGDWVGRHLRGMRKALVAMGRWFGAPSVTLVGDGGAGLAGAGVFRLLRCALATGTSAEARGGRGAAHRGVEVAGAVAQAVGDELRRRRWRGGRGQRAAEILRASELQVSMRGGAVKMV